jgi:hypothetical protein
VVVPSSVYPELNYYRMPDSLNGRWGRKIGAADAMLSIGLGAQFFSVVFFYWGFGRATRGFP